MFYIFTASMRMFNVKLVQVFFIFWTECLQSCISNIIAEIMDISSSRQWVTYHTSRHIHNYINIYIRNYIYVMWLRHKFFLTLKKHKCLQIQHVNVACNFTKQVFMCLMYIVNIVHCSPYNHNVCRRWRAQEFPMWEGCYVVVKWELNLAKDIIVQQGKFW